LNGWFAWWFTWATVITGVVLGLISPTLLADQFGPLLTVANILAFFFSFYLYWHGKAFRRPQERSRATAYPTFGSGRRSIRVLAVSISSCSARRVPASSDKTRRIKT
jgi:hypothetical protein